MHSVSVLLLVVALFTLCLIESCFGRLEDVDPIAFTSQGQLLGKFGESREGKDYLQFLGIPYARVPQTFQVCRCELIRKVWNVQTCEIKEYIFSSQLPQTSGKELRTPQNMEIFVCNTTGWKRKLLDLKIACSSIFSDLWYLIYICNLIFIIQP